VIFFYTSPEDKMDTADPDYHVQESSRSTSHRNTLPLTNFITFADRAGLSDEMAALGCTAAFQDAHLLDLDPSLTVSAGKIRSQRG
jgi:hypothetical protein